jgi:GT2 family glycosyltransferase
MPYKHSPERYEILMACLNEIQDACDIEVCLHEIGTAKTDVPSPYKEASFKYLFTYDDYIFDRAWALNRGAKHIATGDRIVLMDADILLTPDWFDEVRNCNGPSIAYGSMYYMSKESTNKFLESGIFNPEIEAKRKIRKPSILGAAGGVTCMPREVLFNVKGIPEDFRGSWGGEDNAFMLKLIAYGYKVSIFESLVYHLSHDRTTPSNMKVLQKIYKMNKWSKKNWIDHTKSVGDNWGERHENIVTQHEQRCENN